MSSGKFQLECEAFVMVRLVFTHPKNGSVSHYTQDFSPVASISQLKEDMAAKLAVPAEEQVWKYKGQVLQDNQTLDDVEIDADDIIEVTSKLPSG